jgi:SAM-dependent methyltransferase
MQDSRDPRLRPSEIRSRYNHPSWFGSVDRWHRFTADEVRREIARFWVSITVPENCAVLNAGAGGNNLDLLPDNTINLDISERRIQSSAHPLVGSVEAVPLKNNCIDIVLCIGSVINYCDAALTISEFERVLKPNGILILEFESSKSAELITQEAFGRAAAIAETFYCGRPEAVWVYSPAYIFSLLKAASFTRLQQIAVHVLSPWVLLVLRNLTLATLTARLDSFARQFGCLSRFASNHLVFYQKCT